MYKKCYPLHIRDTVEGFILKNSAEEDRFISINIKKFNNHGGLIDDFITSWQISI